ncbi:MAG TPA: TIGR03067 domain-containing protein [Isosphaeraceae bacterium]|jgi:uncharacterized protein (TIGR03067 family)
MKLLIFTAFGIGLVASDCLVARGADDPKADAVKAELKRFEGTWKFVSMEFEGKAVPEASFKDARMTCEGDRFTTKSEQPSKGTFAVDPTVKPKTIDISVEANGQKFKILGIYELEGDTYKICSAAPGQPRPTEFAAPKGRVRGIQVMSRVKP